MPTRLTVSATLPRPSRSARRASPTPRWPANRTPAPKSRSAFTSSTRATDRRPPRRQRALRSVVAIRLRGCRSLRSQAGSKSRRAMKTTAALPLRTGTWTSSCLSSSRGRCAARAGQCRRRKSRRLLRSRAAVQRAAAPRQSLNAPRRRASCSQPHRRQHAAATRRRRRRALADRIAMRTATFALMSSATLADVSLRCFLLRTVALRHRRAFAANGLQSSAGSEVRPCGCNFL